MKPTRSDMLRARALHPYTTPTDVPVTYRLGEVLYHGFPEAFAPTATRRRIDANIYETVITAHTPEGLTLRAECVEYTDYPVVEWVMFVRNDGESDSPILTDWRIDLPLDGASPRLQHGNGDTLRDNGYHWWIDDVTAEGLTVATSGDGTSCNGAFPYLRLFFEDGGINVAVGWTGSWTSTWTATEKGVRLTVGQPNFRSYLRPGEVVRTPRMTFEAFEGGEDRARNLWRSFYIDHILPREDGHPLSPKLILHTYKVGGLPEFCGTTEENQIRGIDAFIEKGLKPDIWWIDAGWYPCDNNWPTTGNWYPNPENWPNGMGAVGDKCAKEDIDFLVWFEPERVRPGTKLWQEHPEYLLFFKGDAEDRRHNNALLDLGNPEALRWAIDTFDGLIKDGRVRVYRQDFNFAPAPYWACNTEENREGILENKHIQGYYAYWDALIERNPGLWMDSCASGGRRNDLETMRRAVPLHYTDVGYGNHPIKQLQHRQMFEWIPYFRAHNMSWDEPDGTYSGKNHPVDEFGYQNALTPSVTSMLEWDDPDELSAIGRRFHPVWRRAAELMLCCDYYPLTECRMSAEDFYAMQFDGEDEGFIQVIRNIGVKTDSIVIFPHVDESKTYVFTDPLGKRSLTVDGKVLARDGWCETLPHRSGVVWFYRKK